MDENETRLPVIQDDPDGQPAPSCSPTVYVSNEEMALLGAMRRLRERSKELKREMRDADRERRSLLEAEIDELRASWKALSARREAAFVRKMIMLGHLPPEADPEEQ
jgi:hypothetical protein